MRKAESRLDDLADPRHGSVSFQPDPRPQPATPPNTSQGDAKPLTAGQPQNTLLHRTAPTYRRSLFGR